MVLHVLYQVITSNEIYLMCDALCDHGLPLSFCYFSFFKIVLLNFHFSLKLFLICSYFSGDFSLTVLSKCVLNNKKVYYDREDYMETKKRKNRLSCWRSLVCSRGRQRRSLSQRRLYGNLWQLDWKRTHGLKFST